MKVVFCSDLGGESSSGRQRLWALQQCGGQVEVLDTSRFRPLWGRWAGAAAKITRDFRRLRRAGRLEEELLRLVSDSHPDLVWVEWPREYRRKALQAVKDSPSAPLLLSFQDDNPWGDRSGDHWMWKRYLAVADLFDIHLAKRPSDVIHLRQLGARDVRLWVHGVYSPLFHPDPASAIRYPATFVGTCMDERATLLTRILEAGIPIHVFGTHWDKRTDLPRRFPENFHGEVVGDRYADVLRASQVSVGLVSASNRDEWTMRTFEIVGCGNALLAQRTPSHEAWFEEGREAEFFSSTEECIDRLRLLVDRPARCIELGRAAHAKALAAGWTLEERMSALLQEVDSSCTPRH